MADTVIKIENLSKIYRLGEVGTGTISHDLNRWWAKMVGKEDPFAKVGRSNDRTQIAKKGEYVYALKNLNFKVEKGEILGIIGKNGAGKSTLLKILSQITSPTEGSIKVKGRIGALLEVGTGFHPEMTGRENVYLNGTILGMTKKEIDRKFEEIMDFAGCLKYADTPVKRYSSGMMVRLGFAVAAFLEPEILIVDEVLAVGDAEFQSRAIGKMHEISSGQGRTVLFVSHNMGSIQSLCSHCHVLDCGEVVFAGTTDKAINYYLKSGISIKGKISFNGSLQKDIVFNGLKINGLDPENHNAKINSDTNSSFEFYYTTKSDITVRASFSLFRDGIRLFTLHDVNKPLLIAANKDVKSFFSVPPNFLRPGYYQIGFGFYENNIYGDWMWSENICSFEVLSIWNQVYEERAFGIINLADFEATREENKTIA